MKTHIAASVVAESATAAGCELEQQRLTADLFAGHAP